MAQTRPRLVLGLLAGAALLVLSGWVGWSSRSPAHHDVTVTDSFVGKITNLNLNHNSGCIQTSKRHVCGAVVSFDPKSLRQGQSVRAVPESYKNAAGDGVEIIVIVPTAQQIG